MSKLPNMKITSTESDLDSEQVALMFSHAKEINDNLLKRMTPEQHLLIYENLLRTLPYRRDRLYSIPGKLLK